MQDDQTEIDNKKRRKNVIRDIKSVDKELKTHFGKCLNSKGTRILLLEIAIWIIFLLQAVKNYTDKTTMAFIAIFLIAIYFFSVSILYWFSAYKITYNSGERHLIIKRFFRTIIIPIDRLKKSISSVVLLGNVIHVRVGGSMITVNIYIYSI